tara:strand:- start:44 stop:253 length:210 start_codon:yes stop_codon:yes gene_type:complete
MSKQYHYVIVYDEDNNAFSIDWDTTGVILEENQGTVFDKDTQEWELGFENETYETVYDKLNKLLEIQNV